MELFLWKMLGATVGGVCVIFLIAVVLSKVEVDE